MTPTQRTLAYLRTLGYTACVVERWNPHARIRQDAFGALDILALHPMQLGVLGVQCTSGANAAARVKKLEGLETMDLWMAAGNPLWVIGWRKVGKRGERKRWEPRVAILQRRMDWRPA